MDIVHDGLADFAAPFFPEGMVDKDDVKTQMVIYYLILSVGGAFFYLFFAGLSFWYSFVYNKSKLFPTTIKEEDLYKQARCEIEIALTSVWKMAFLMWPGAFFSHRGYSQIYKEWPTDAAGWGYFVGSNIWFFIFTDFCIYWAHRGLHHPMLYRRIHKLHHTFQYTTPFSSHAFHPVDGFTQGCPYYIFIYLFPFHNVQFLMMFILVNMWTINIHDQIDLGNKYLSSTGHHTIHHVDFWYNYGQYTTLWDRIGGTYMPAPQTHDWHGNRVGPSYVPLGDKTAKPEDKKKQ
eukprot:Rhum_TRINITY_DN12625_c0_g2::Rhum_TRINITY_DN12625_c0_g2_i1::g.53076::m.53076/K00227/SC5DL, ERG3; Delta7-sterol 5-desaturase